MLYIIYIHDGTSSWMTDCVGLSISLLTRNCMRSMKHVRSYSQTADRKRRRRPNGRILSFLLSLSPFASCYCTAGATSFFLFFTTRLLFYKCLSRASCCCCWPLVKSIMSSVTYFFFLVCDRVCWTWRVQKKKKSEATKKKKWEEEEEEEEKEIWSGTDGMYDATRYTKKKMMKT